MTTSRRYQRNHYQRLIGWVFIYLCIFAGFLAAIYWQTRKVNTLDFPTGQLQITASKAKYTVGDSINYTIKNGLATAVTLVNNCPQEPLHVYQWENSQWVRIHDTADATTCANRPKQVIIPAGGSISNNYTAWPKLFAKPGIYRLVAFANNYTALPYADFQIVAPPAPAQAAPAPQVIYKQIYTPVYTPVYTPIYIPTPAPATTNQDN